MASCPLSELSLTASPSTPSRSGAYTGGFSVARRKDSERGAAAVEMAVLTIFLCLLVMGVIDVGRLIFTGLAVEDAAQTGVAYASFVETATVDEVKTRVVNSVDSPIIDPNLVTVTCATDPRPKKDGANVQVTVQNQVTLITPLIGQMLGGSVTLQKTAAADRYFECDAIPIS